MQRAHWSGSAIVAVLVSASCGRIGFDPTAASGDGGRSDAVVDPDLIAWWRLDGSPPVAIDELGRHHGACTGQTCPATATGTDNGAWQFDGLDDMVRVPYDAELGSPTAFTIACWFRVASLPARASLVAKPFGGNERDSWQLSTDPGGELVFVTADVVGTARINAPGAFQADAWVHVAGTFDGTTKRLFVDGVQAGEQASALMVDTNDLLIGADENSGALVDWFPGLIDDVRLYRRALAEQEVRTLAGR